MMAGDRGVVVACLRVQLGLCMLIDAVPSLASTSAICWKGLLDLPATHTLSHFEQLQTLGL
jgi:hypothetical protein